MSSGVGRFKAGDRVHVRFAEPPGHIRTPHYVRGKTGVVERYYGDFPNPEELAYGKDGLPPRPLYLVGFRQGDVWGESPAPADKLYVDLYEHWLEPT